MKLLFALLVTVSSGLRLQAPILKNDPGEHQRWQVVLSKTSQNGEVRPSFSHEHFSFTKNSGSCAEIGEPHGEEIFLMSQDDNICLAGKGFQSRANSTVSMIKEAVNALHQRGVKVKNFAKKRINIGDASSCEYDYAYNLKWSEPKDCKTQLFPDFTFVSWAEAGLAPFTGLVEELHDLSKKPAEKAKCGWAGNPGTNAWRKNFVAEAPRDLYDIVTPEQSTGTGGGRVSMQRQVEQWACMVDLPGKGYSGRVPMLLHAGRPLVMVERDNGGQEPRHFTDRVWYADMLKQDVHYIGVYSNLTNMEAAAEKALTKEGLEMAQRAQDLAKEKLTHEGAMEYIAKLLSDI